MAGKYPKKHAFQTNTYNEKNGNSKIAMKFLDSRPSLIFAGYPLPSTIDQKQPFKRRNGKSSSFRTLISMTKSSKYMENFQVAMLDFGRAWGYLLKMENYGDVLCVGFQGFWPHMSSTASLMELPNAAIKPSHYINRSAFHPLTSPPPKLLEVRETMKPTNDQLMITCLNPYIINSYWFYRW